jgi:hypothetical protein
MGVVLLALLTVAWASVGRANASTTAQAGTSGKQSAQDAPSARPGLPIPFLGYDPSQSRTGSGQPAASGKGQAADHQTGSGLGPDLSTILAQAGKKGETGGSGSAIPIPAASPTCGPEWSVVTTPNYPLHSSYLYALAEAGPNDVWAGGYYGNDASPSESLPFSEHWNGTTWSVVAAPLPAGGVNGLIWSISVNTSSDVWAVGYYSDGTNTFELIERWNGIQWNTVAGSNPSATDNELYGVAVVSTNNVWAAGFYKAAGLDKTFVDHWNGATWTHVASPNHGTGDNSLADISVVPGSSGSDIWAVGNYSMTPGGTQQTLTLHYDGTNWSYVVSLDQGAGNNGLIGVHAISANDVWAVGTYSSGTAAHTLAEHWSSSAWSIVTTVDPGPTTNQLIRVFATASNDVWAAGYSTTGTIPSSLVEHWNGTAWSVSTNAPVGYANLLVGITGSSSSDLWTVGAYDPTSSTNIAETVIEHYNGTSWSPVYAPNAPTNYNILYSVSALSATDIWAAGFSQGYIGSTQTNQAVIEHWNGTNWSLFQSPHPTAHGDDLISVKAISTNDVWAVGSYRNATNDQTLIEHWNGTDWSQITSPNPGGGAHDNDLLGVDAASANDAWAAGYYVNGTADQTLILHWNGSAWVQFASPNPGINSDQLQDVAVVPGSGGNDAWVTGFYKNIPADKYSTLFEHWNGTTWSVVSSPNVGGVDNEPVRIFALSANDVWAVGYTVDSSSLDRNLVLHWNGTSWSISPIVQQGPYGNVLLGGTALAPNDVYVVGQYLNAGSLPQSLIEHWNGSAWSVVPSVPSPGSGAAITEIVALSSSNMWAVGGYLPTGFNPPNGTAQTMAQRFFPCLSSCTISFSDVPVGSTFYPYIHCLACLGIINGYSDGSFKPNANVTRGQLSKIVANAAGFNDPQPDQMFQDVLVGSTFQVYIGRLASRGYISGYACGGAGSLACRPATCPTSALTPMLPVGRSVRS